MSAIAVIKKQALDICTHLHFTFHLRTRQSDGIHTHIFENLSTTYHPMFVNTSTGCQIAGWRLLPIIQSSPPYPTLSGMLLSVLATPQTVLTPVLIPGLF